MAYHFSFSNKYNTERLFDIDTSGFEYHSLEEVYESPDEVFTVRGLYVNTRGKFDDQGVIATDSEYINLPSHLTPMVREVLQDKEAIKAINEGAVGFTIYKYTQQRYNKECYSIKWVDITPDGGLNDPLS